MSHVCETRKFVIALLHWKQGLLCDKTSCHSRIPMSLLDYLMASNCVPYESCNGVLNQRTDSPESRLEGNGLEVFTLFCSKLLEAFKIQNNLTIRQYYMQAYF